MSRWATLSLVAVCCSLVYVHPSDARQLPDVAPGQLIVRFEAHVPQAARQQIRAVLHARNHRPLLLPDAELLLGVGDVFDAARKAARLPGVRYAEPNYRVRLHERIPNDSRFPEAWGLHNTGQSIRGIRGTPDADLDAPEAWDLSKGGTSVVVAVVDDGIAFSHPDLRANAWSNPSETLNGRDDDGNGFVDDMTGWDFVDGDNDPQPSVSDGIHGTHVAGIIAAQGDNGVGMAGVMWQARLMSLRVCATLCDTAAMVSAFVYAAQEGARVVNVSLGGPSYSQSQLDAIESAPNTLFVIAAGNGGEDGVGDSVDAQPQYPCALPASNIVCVAATDQRDELTTFSNYGAESVDLAAPGGSILSTIPVMGQGSPVAVLADDFEGSFSWLSGGSPDTWDRTTAGYVSPSHSLTDSPRSIYAPYTWNWAISPTIEASGLSECELRFDYWLDTEENYDYFAVRASSDGSEWFFIGADSGYYGAWVEGTLDLTDLSGGPFWLSFDLVSDDLVEYDGVYIDDVLVSCARAAIVGYDYAYLDGTSMAAPHVTGVLGLMLSVCASCSASLVRPKLRDTDSPS